MLIVNNFIETNCFLVHSALRKGTLIGVLFVGACNSKKQPKWINIKFCHLPLIFQACENLLL